MTGCQPASVGSNSLAPLPPPTVNKKPIRGQGGRFYSKNAAFQCGADGFRKALSLKAQPRAPSFHLWNLEVASRRRAATCLWKVCALRDSTPDLTPLLPLSRRASGCTAVSTASTRQSSSEYLPRSLLHTPTPTPNPSHHCFSRCTDCIFMKVSHSTWRHLHRSTPNGD